MYKLQLLFILLFINKPSVLAGTAFCSFEHTNRYFSDLISDEITGYMCKLDFDVKGDRVNDIGGYHEGGERDSQVDIIKVQQDFYSYLTSYPDTFCKRFPKLEIIDMCGAEIATIEADSLAKCKDLRILQFYMNKLDQIPEKLLAGNKKLLKLYIAFNQITTLPESLLNGLKELKLLDLSYNKINVLPDLIFKGLSTLKELNLEANKLETLEPVLFEDLVNLEKLNLNGNGIFELEALLFAPLTKLKELQLKENNLTTIHADSFPQTANIETVVLSKNQITAIDELFIDNCGIITLKMSGNVCDKTSTIKKEDMKKKLKACFKKYEEKYNEETAEESSTTIIKTTTTKKTTSPRTTKTSTTTTTEEPSNEEPSTEVIEEEEVTTTTQKTTTTTKKPTTTSTTKPPKTTTDKPTTTTEKPTTTTEKPTTTTEKPTTTTTTEKLTTTTTTEMTTTTSEPPTKKIDALYEPCGVAKVGVPNIVNGEVIVHGTHPWIAAIIYESKYLCGGTLVTNKKVVSAAHCFYGKDLIEKEAEQAVVLLGAQHLDNSNEVGRVIVGVDKILVHPRWNPQKERFEADIAVLILDDEVAYSLYIQPACVARLNGDLKNMNDGIIVGFGKSESSTSHENEPRKANTPIQKTEECFEKFINLVDIAARGTFCGGNANGTGACTGDSGGGLTVVNNGRYFLRGVVSASLYGSKYGCNVDSYSIFTDMRFYITFVRDAK